MQMNMPPKYQHQNHHPHHAQQHHHNQAHNHGGHGGHGGSINHQHTYSSGGLSNATPHFTPNQLQNGTPSNATDSMDEPMSEHWQQQLQLAEVARHSDSPHYHARSNAQANKGVVQQTTGTNGTKTDGSDEGRNRPMTQKDTSRQDWMAIDFGAQGLRALAPTLFTYVFLDKLYLNNNRLRTLPAAIGKLKNLTHLDLSCNQLSELPPEIGMLVNLKQLLLFDNELHDLPYDLGSLFQLEVLGIEGNPLDEGYMDKMKSDGTKGLIETLREDNPGKCFNLYPC
jgi:CCR4-NOT transcription complex subunit 6